MITQKLKSNVQLLSFGGCSAQSCNSPYLFCLSSRFALLMTFGLGKALLNYHTIVQ